ncbi:MAG: hypothetical protein ABL923_12280 [Burkholderiaceae bacterium]
MHDDSDEKQRKMVESCVEFRPRTKTPAFEDLVKEIDNPLMAELMWIYWGVDAIKTLDQAPPYLNSHLRWWKFGQEKRTMRKLLQTPTGKAEVWQMLNDAAAWVL